jgi:hypothetical protein
VAEMWIPLESEVYKNWVDTTIEKAEAKLNEWELKFIYSIKDRLASGSALTELQAKKLESIYFKKTK